jgi:ABC-type phosphate/phosphonate transport system permease subunit
MSAGSAHRGAKKKPAPAKSKSKTKKKSHSWLAWWPVVVGAVLSPFAVQAVDIFALSGRRWAAWLMVPWTFMLQSNPLHLSAANSDYLAGGVMYAQFPVYGLLLMLLLRRFRAGTAVGVVLAIHLLGFAAQAAFATS